MNKTTYFLTVVIGQPFLTARLKTWPWPQVCMLRLTICDSKHENLTLTSGRGCLSRPFRTARIKTRPLTSGLACWSRPFRTARFKTRPLTSGLACWSRPFVTARIKTWTLTSGLACFGWPFRTARIKTRPLTSGLGCWGQPWPAYPVLSTAWPGHLTHSRWSWPAATQ